MKTRIINRGTTVLNLETCPPNSAGVLYQKCQQDSMASLPSKTIISTKRGTGRMKASEYPKVESNLPNWGFITTARGTARLILKDKEKTVHENLNDHEKVECPICNREIQPYWEPRYNGVRATCDMCGINWQES